MEAWKDQYEVKKLLECRIPSISCIYTSAVTAFVEFSALTPTELIDEIEADRESPARARY